MSWPFLPSVQALSMLSTTFLRHTPLSKHPVARALVSSERQVQACGHMETAASVPVVSGEPQRLAPFQPQSLPFHEANDDHRVISLASLQALRGSQPDAIAFLGLSFENLTCRGT